MKKLQSKSSNKQRKLTEKQWHEMTKFEKIAIIATGVMLIGAGVTAFNGISSRSAQYSTSSEKTRTEAKSDTASTPAPPTSSITKLPSSTPSDVKLLVTGFDEANLEASAKDKLTEFLSSDGGDTFNATITLYTRENDDASIVAKYVIDSVSDPAKTIFKLSLFKDGALVNEIDGWQP